MNTYRCIRKNAKALSPVVASIILIAVTVAVSVAVAAWMGGMTVGFMGTTSATVTDVDFNTATPDAIDVTVKNTGTKSFTIATIKVNNVPVTFTSNTTSVPAGDGASLVLDASWIDGNTYKIDLFDGSNQAIGSTQQNAPGA